MPLVFVGKQMLIGSLRTVLDACLQVTAIVSVCSAIALPFARQRNVLPLLGLLLFIALDTFVLVVPPVFHWELGQYNWAGKVASIALSLLVARFYFSSSEIGLRLPRSRSEILWTVFGIVVAALAAFPPGLLEPSPPPDLETYTFEATLPGIDEELAFRGVGLACLIRAFSVTGIDKRARVLALLVTALWFTAGHIINLQHGHLVITWHRVLDVFPFGIWMAIIRLKAAAC